MTYLKEGQENIITCLDTFGCLTVEQLKEIVRKTSEHLTEKQVEAQIKQLKQTQQIFISDNEQFAALNPLNLGVPKITTISAFWLFLDFYKAADGCFSKGKYPSDIVFNVDDKTFRIIIVADPKCSEIRLLKASESIPEVTDLLVSLFTDLEDVPEEILPDQNFYFVRAKRKEDIFAKPDFTMTKFEIEG